MSDEDPATINSVPYPIAIGDRGETLWQTTSHAQNIPDEVWEDWSLSVGETKRETGRGYLFARGWDGSTRGALRLSPFFHNLNVTTLTTGYGYMMEDVDDSAATLAIDTTNNGTSTTSGNIPTNQTLTFAHTCDSNAERLLKVGLEIDERLAPSTVNTELKITYAGIGLTFLGGKTGASGTDVTVALWFLLDPPTGANNIVITNTSTQSARDVVAGAVSYSGVNQDDTFGTLVGTTGTDGTPTATVTTAADEEILAVVGIEGTERVSAGTNETEKWDATQDVGSGSGFTQDGVNGGVMAPSLDAQAGTEKWVEIAVSIKPSSTTSRPIIYYSDTTLIHNYTYDSDTGITAGSDRTVGGVAGRPAKVNGNWYSPAGSGANAEKLTNVTWADVTGTWRADHLSTFQKGVTPTVARVNSTTQNTVELNADTGDITDTWTNESEKVGDTSTKITDLLEMQGQLFPCKEDNLYRFGTEAESFPVIPFIQRGKIDSDNGKGSFAFGDEIVYMSKGDLWRHKIGRGSLPIGLNTIRSWRKIDDIIDTPKDGRPVFGVHVGEYWYYLENDGEVSHLIQARKRREGDPAGHELIQHSVLTIPISKGLGADSKNQLWIKGASTDETVRDIRVIELAEDGSLDVQNRRGQADAAHDIDFDERNPGRPQDKVQIRHMTVETEGDWDATTSLQLKLFRDNATTPTSIGSAITTAGVTVRNPTVGTSDTAFRLRPRLTLTTNSSYTPRSSDPQVLRVIVGLRSPDIIRIVIPADDGILKEYSLTAIDVEQNLRRLQNQGTVTFRRLGDTTTTFSAEVFSVTDVMYATKDGFAHGIELQLRSFVTA